MVPVTGRCGRISRRWTGRRNANDFRSWAGGSVLAGLASSAVAGSGMGGKLRTLVRHADGCSASRERRALPAAQFRGPLEARVDFDFRQWGKLQMALAGGSEHMNVLAPASGSASPAPSGGTPAPGAAVLPGSTARELVFGAGVGSMFSAGCLIAVDVDYQQQIGYVGSGIAAAYVSSPAAVKQDPNYVRRVTFNVGRVAEVTATSVAADRSRYWEECLRRAHRPRSWWRL